MLCCPQPNPIKPSRHLAPPASRLYTVTAFLQPLLFSAIDHRYNVPVASKPGLRERNKLERRHRLEEVALELFERDGFDKTTIDKISEAAGLAPRTFFSYFPTKDDLVLADYSQRLDRILTELNTRPVTEAPWSSLRAAFATVASDYQAQRDQIRRRFVIVSQNPSVFARSLQLQAGWEQELANQIAKRLDAQDCELTAQLLAAGALAVMRSSIQYWVSSPRSKELPELVEQGFDQFAKGLAANA